MKALVIGGNGFIGSHLVDRLIQEEWIVSVFDLYQRRYDEIPPQVRFIQGDLNQTYLVREALVGIDVVFHLAWASIHEISNQDLEADIQANLLPSIHLLEACQWANVQRVVFTSSGGTVYGPMQEGMISETHPQFPINSYGILKLAFEKYLQMFKHLYGLDYVALRPSVPYGPRQNPMGRQGAVAVFLYKVLHNQPITIWGDGNISRDYFFITDLVEALVKSASADLKKDRIFNIGGSKEISLCQLVELIEEVTGKKAVLEYLPPRAFDVPRIKLDTRLAQSQLDWQPKIEMPEGLMQLWRWLSTQYPG